MREKLKYFFRKKRRKISFSIIAILIIIVIVFSVVSHVVFHRSAAASVAEIGISLGNGGFLLTAENAEKHLRDRAAAEDEPYVLDTGKYPGGAVKTWGEYELVVFGREENRRKTILYLHGGAYVDQLTDLHTDFCNDLANHTDSYVVMPVYPLAPNHTYEETYAFLDSLYPELRNSSEELTIMGDSAGGGLAVAYCEYLAEKGMEQPDHLIAISPWLDISMTSSDYAPYQETDPMLRVEGTVVMGKAWAGDTDTKNYMLSPYYGDVSGLPETTLFVGTREILYPDVTSFCQKLKDAGVDAVLHVGEGMNHIYPLYPIVPEAGEAKTIIYDVINGKEEK